MFWREKRKRFVWDSISYLWKVVKWKWSRWWGDWNELEDWTWRNGEDNLTMHNEKRREEMDLVWLFISHYWQYAKCTVIMKASIIWIHWNWSFESSPSLLNQLTNQVWLIFISSINSLFSTHPQPNHNNNYINNQFAG